MYGNFNAHQATTSPIIPIKSFFKNSLNNVNVGGVSIGLNYIPSEPYVYKNQSPTPATNAFPFYGKLNIFK
jgi:hypothetical protein